MRTVVSLPRRAIVSSIGDVENQSSEIVETAETTETTETVEQEEARLALLMAGQAESLADVMVERIMTTVPAYTTGLVDPGGLRRECLGMIAHILEPIARGETPALDVFDDTGRAVAGVGIPLTALLDAFRVASVSAWEQFVAIAPALNVSVEVVLRIATRFLQLLDLFTREMAKGYRDEIGAQIRSEEQRRSALVQALLEGRLDDTNLWEAADLLHLPQNGPYVVIAARVADIGSHALPQIERGLGGLGIDSAWRLMHDVEIGVARLPRPGEDQFDRLVAALEIGTGRVGVSPPYDDLRTTSQSLRLARIALHGALDHRKVVVFGRDPLSAAASSAPDIMSRVARTVLAGLDAMPAPDRALLLDTFGAWLDCGGSYEETAKQLFVHPNTVRYRLRRLEERTGRSLSDPRANAELSLAFEIDRRRLEN
jgi:hypothetical protein